MTVLREKDILKEIRSILKEDQIIIDAPMREHTSMRVGGKAKMLLLPSSIQEIRDIKKELVSMNIPHYIMGKGTNLVVTDRGYSGVVIKLAENYSDITVKGDEIIAAAGAYMVTISNLAMRHSLSGLEFAAGIPGTVGGAVAMNAGAYEGVMKDVVSRTVCIDNTGELVSLTSDEHEFGYRTSTIQKKGLLVLEVKIKLVKGEYDKIKGKMNLFSSMRREKQPLNLPSAGSVFKRPDGCFAGKLIEDAGLRGYRIGGAQVSEKHCGFIVNTGNATAADVIQLIDHIKNQVLQNSGVILEQEVRILGG